MAAKIFRINYKSDFILTLNSDAGWAIPFCIKFFTSVPSRAYFVGYDGTTYTHCSYDPSEPTKLVVQFDDHHLPIGDLNFQIAYHFTVADFPNDTEDEVINPAAITTEIDGETYHVMLDFTGETAPEIEFNLPAYANEAERIQNELQRQQNEAARIEAELEREQASAAAVQGAENVNAQLNGTTLTVTNRNGVSTSVNTKGAQGEQGPVGPKGPQGEAGPQGIQGPAGPQGIQGPEGPQGETGISIVDFSPKSQTETTLIYTVTFSNGHTQDVAIPKGPKGDTGATGPTGPQGQQGETGVSITDFVETGETETATIYNITFSNGTTQAVAIPKGEKGDQGPVGPQGPQGPMGDVSVITPEQQAAFTMYSTTGQNTDGPMTQKAVTDSFGFNENIGQNGKAIYLNVGIGNTVANMVIDTYATCTEFTVNEGDVLFISGQGGSSARAFGFIDSNRILIAVAEPGKLYENEVLIVPSGADKVVLNNIIVSTPAGIPAYINYKWYYSKRGSVWADAIISSRTYNVLGETVDTSSLKKYNGIVIDAANSPTGQIAINWDSTNLKYTRHIVVPVLPGSLYELTANENRNTIIVFAKSYAPSTSYPSNVDYATGWEKRLIFSGTVKVHVPSDAKFMIASAVNTSNQDNTPTIRLLSSNERLTMLEDETAVYYPLDKSTYQPTSYIIKYGNPTQWQSVAGHGGYFIPVLPSKRYKITANENSPAMYAFLSSNSTSGNVQYALGWSSYEELHQGNSKEYVSPYNATYLWVYRNHTTQGDKTPYVDIEMSVDNAVDNLEGRVSVLEAETGGNTPNYIDLMKIGCAGDGVTDDTSLIQGAINSIVANGGGVIYGGRNVYKIIQLVIPDLRPLQTNGKIITLELRGETPAMTIFGTIGSYQELGDSIRGTMMLKSDLNNGEAIIKYAGTDFCSSLVVFRNIQLRCYENPNCSGFDFSKLGKIIMQNVMIDTGIYGVNSIEPTRESYGIILPIVNNSAMTLLDNVLVSGFNYGISMGENADIRSLSIMECKKGIYFPTNFGYHSADIGRANVYRCTYPVYVNGTSYFHIGNLNIEKAGDTQYTEDNQWQETINELYDPQSKGYGFIRWNTVKGMEGNVNEFSIQGGNNIVVKWIGEE